MLNLLGKVLVKIYPRPRKSQENQEQNLKLPGFLQRRENSTFLDDFIKDTPDLTLAQIGTGGKRNADLMDLEIPIAERIDQ
jgi:hypothetical protein